MEDFKKKGRKVPEDLATEIGRKVPFEYMEQEIFLNLIRSSEYVSGRLDRIFKEYEITQPQYNVLKILQVENEHKAPIKKIGQRLVTRQPDVTRLIDRLERSGLVERCRCLSDRRIIYVKLKDKGMQMLHQLGPLLKEAQIGIMGHMGPAKLATLNRLLFEVRHPAAVKSQEPTG